MTLPHRLGGLTAVVTGAGRGIGRAIAARFVDEGARVVLEITERTSLEGEHDVRYRVAELRELGFKIAIDDLGGGHARMHTFTPLDTDFVKLDMSLVRDIDKHAMKQRLVRSVTELCKDQGTKVIGEGVETEAEAKVLVDLGCDYLQGYLIARPAPPPF